MLVLADVTPLYAQPSTWLAVLALVAVAILIYRSLSPKRGEGQGEGKTNLAPPPTLPAPKLELPKVQLPPSEAEAQKRADLEAARLKALELGNQRVAATTEAESARLRDEIEAAKKEAYRAEKALEVEEKDRKKREREEAERQAAQAAKDAVEAAARAAQAAKESEQRKIDAESGQTLAAGLAKTKREGFMSRLAGLFGGAPRQVDESVLAELEEVLFTADIGVKTASALVEHARTVAKSKALGSAELKSVIREEVARIVDLKSNHALKGGGPPHVIMVVGVNGAGKTTTIGKLAAKAKDSGLKVLLGAGDTFRAAAAEQLDVWAVRAGAEIVKGKDEADPASVIFEAVKQGVEKKVDLVIADTAGRLHTKANLMEELKKVKRVIEKALPGAPHEVLLVLDSTNGQNAIMQARQFHDAVGITSIALTKLDGTAKGGVIIGICDELKLPVTWAGVGEKVADLRPFDPKEFVAALFD
jgi:fused signal recognition particle receptor